MVVNYRSICFITLAPGGLIKMEGSETLLLREGREVGMEANIEN